MPNARDFLDSLLPEHVARRVNGQTVRQNLLGRGLPPVPNRQADQPITAPPGVRTDDLIEQARHLGENPWPSTPPSALAVGAGMQWFDRVKPGGAWDFKSKYPDGRRLYEGYGNFAFGATGKAMGIPDEVLLRGAGWAQKHYNRPGAGYDPAWGNFLSGGSHGDDPRDQVSIKKGIAYADAYLAAQREARGRSEPKAGR